MKIVTAHQMALMPWAGLIHKALLSDIFICMDLAQFRARAFMHRNIIELNKCPYWLTWPIKDLKKTQLLKDLRFRGDANDLLEWLDSSRKKIESDHSKSQYFAQVREYFKHLEKYIQNNQDATPVDVFMHEFAYILKNLNINTQLVRESDIINSSACLKGENRFIEHCQETKADIYILGQNSVDYCDYNQVINRKVKVYVQNYNYDGLRSCQSSDQPCAVIQQIAKIGWDGLEACLKVNNTTKGLLRDEMNSKTFGIGTSFFNSVQEWEKQQSSN